jgi:hypothetical protein
MWLIDDALEVTGGIEVDVKQPDSLAFRRESDAIGVDKLLNFRVCRD